MKKVLFVCIALTIGQLCRGQQGFGLDGSLGFGLNGSEMINPIFLEGRVQWNDNLSTNLGLGLWNSGFKSVWSSEAGNTATIYKITDNKALPSVQLSMKGQLPLGRFLNHDWKIFAEPRLIFLPFSGRTTYLNELYYTIETDGTKTANPSEDNYQRSLNSDCHPRFYYSIGCGVSVDLWEDADLSIGYARSDIDLFKDLRGTAIQGSTTNFPLDDKGLPKPGLHLITVSLNYHFNLN
jgi:hypothetical protein